MITAIDIDVEQLELSSGLEAIESQRAAAQSVDNNVTAVIASELEISDMVGEIDGIGPAHLHLRVHVGAEGGGKLQTGFCKDVCVVNRSGRVLLRHDPRLH